MCLYLTVTGTNVFVFDRKKYFVFDRKKCFVFDRKKCVAFDRKNCCVYDREKCFAFDRKKYLIYDRKKFFICQGFYVYVLYLTGRHDLNLSGTVFNVTGIYVSFVLTKWNINLLL